MYFCGGIPGGNNRTQSQIANPKTSRVIKLNNDMVHTDGSASVIDTSMGLFNYKGIFLKNPVIFFGVSGNNHYAVFKFNNQWYVIYHAQTLVKAFRYCKRLSSPRNMTEAETIGWNGGTLNVSPTGGNKNCKQIQCNLQKISGVHNVFLKFTGTNNKNLFNIDYWQFN